MENVGTLVADERVREGAAEHHDEARYTEKHEHVVGRHEDGTEKQRNADEEADDGGGGHELSVFQR